MGIITLNCRLGLNLGIPAIQHCYALAKSSGRRGRYFLKAKDTDHQLVTKLSSSRKRVDDVMAVVQGNWEFGEGEDRLDGIPRRRGEPGNDLKKVLTSTNDAKFEAIAEATKSNQSETEVDEALKLAFEEAGLNSADPPSTSGREDRLLDDIFHGLEDLPVTFPDDMDGLSLTKVAKKANIRAAESQSQSSLPVIEGTTKNGSTEAKPFVQASVEAEQRVEKRPADVEAGSEENRADKRPRLEESDVIVPFVIQPKIKNMLISTDASVIKDPAVALSLATSVSLPADKAAFRAEPNLVAIGLAAQLALLAVERIANMGRRYHDAVELIGRLQAEVEGQRSRVETEGARAEAVMERARNAKELRSVTEKRADANDDALKLAQEAIYKLEVGLEEMKAAKETTDLKASSAFDAGKKSAFDEYVDEVPKFEN
ncbi:hypothetical protein CsSME_00053128 [Camellia sinensis var. sinensis]